MSTETYMVGQVITTEPEANALPVGSIIRDNMHDARVKMTERGWELSGEVGLWGPTWIAFPATILHLPAADAERGTEPVSTDTPPPQDYPTPGAVP